MTFLPFLDTKATPLCSIDSGVSRTRSSVAQPTRICTPKIKILPRSDEPLKHLPHPKPAAVKAHGAIWKPLVREPPDYDYHWEPVQREDIRHQYDHYVAPPRIVTSRPDAPYRMSSRFETQDRHLHNYRRTRDMQQRQWNKEHIQYTIFPYSQIAERESYNQHIRSTLKEQMKGKLQSDKNEQQRRSLECQSIIKKDQQDLEQQRLQQKQRASALLQYTNRNKELMENKWQYDRWNRAHQWHVERTILADDPINWSKTLT